MTRETIMEQNEDRKAIQPKNTDATLDEISEELKPGETLVLDVSDCDVRQTDVIYDTLVMKGYDVKMSSDKGKEQVIVFRKNRL